MHFRMRPCLMAPLAHAGARRISWHRKARLTFTVKISWFNLKEE
jgi:hypothetical protein